MDKKELSKQKLAGLRTLAGDRTKNNKPEIKTGEVNELKPAKGTKPLPTPPQKNPEDKKSKTVTADLPQPPVIDSKDKDNEDNLKNTVNESIKEIGDFSGVTSGKKIKIDNEEDFSATVITDNKKDRFSLFPAIIDSIKTWFKDLKKSYYAKKEPKYTVPETTRRKGVIQKATSKTGITSGSDNANIQEGIRHRQEKESDHPHTFWTPNTEPGKPLLDEANDEEDLNSGNDTKPNTSTPHKNFHTNQQEIVVENLKTPKKEKPDKTPEVKDTETKEETNLSSDKETLSQETKPDKNESRWSSRLPTVNHSDKSTKSGPRESAKEAKPAIEPPTGKIKTRPVAPPGNSKKDEGALFKLNINLLSFTVVVIFISLIAAGGLGYVWFKNYQQKTLPPSAEYTGVINHEVDLIFEPITDRKTFIERIISEYSQSSDNISQFAFVTSEKKKNVINPGILLGFLGADLEPSFNRSITQLYFGSLSKDKPFIALKITDRTTAIAGMIKWEKSMREDLFTMFKLRDIDEAEESITEEEEPKETEDEADSNTTPKFIDASLSGIDVRILRNQAEEEEIIYGFADDNTIIITTDHNTLGKLLELLK